MVEYFMMKFPRIILISMMVIMKMYTDSVTVDKNVLQIHTLYLFHTVLCQNVNKNIMFK
jgi:hypothetical protein